MPDAIKWSIHLVIHQASNSDEFVALAQDHTLDCVGRCLWKVSGNRPHLFGYHYL